MFRQLDNSIPLPRAIPAGESPVGGTGRLRLQSVWKQFDQAGVPVLEDVSLTCAPGEFVVVVGPSGCGKTTLLNLAAGIVMPDAGSVTLDGNPVTAPGPDRAMVFQDHALFPWLTASQNVEFGLKMAGISQCDRRDRVADALRLVHLSGSGDKFPHQLSGGMKQRVAIARAMVMKPAVLCMDEPFAAVDAQTRELLHAHVQELWLQTRTTVLFVTHSVSEAVRLADRVVVLHAHPGRIRREFRVELAHPRDPDSADVAAIARRIRREISEEVNRVNAQLAGEFRNTASSDLLGGHFAGLGDGI